MSETAAIILAAGLSRRMGRDNKLLLPFGGVSMIAHVVQTYRAAIDGDVIVVTGHDAQRVQAILEGLDVRIEYNSLFNQGQATSVKTGLQAVANAASILIGLGDQPSLTRTDIKDLVVAHNKTDGTKISIPHNGHQRGNPILVPESMRNRLLSDTRHPGCRRFTRAYPEAVQMLDLANPGFFQDVDTPQDYAALQNTLLKEIAL
ncbi:MAG: nucleotidyltransferase family protein [Pseudomonadota bacterium]